MSTALTIHTEMDAPSDDNALVVLEEILNKLASIAFVEEAKELADQAAALGIYAKRAKKGLTVQNHCAWVKLLSERRAGELLMEMEKLSGRPEKASTVPRLCDLGIGYDQSRRWQRLAKVPVETFMSVRTVCDREKTELTSAGLDREVQKYLTEGKDTFHNESAIAVAVRLLLTPVQQFLEHGYKEDLHLDVILRDRTLHHYEVEFIRRHLLDLRRRVNERIEKLTQRMTIDVDELDVAERAREAALENEADSQKGKVGEGDKSN